MEQNFGSSTDIGNRPGQVTTIMILTLISGITNIIAACLWSFFIVVGTIGIGIICAPITLLPGVLGVFEIIYAAKLLSNPPKPVKPSQTLSILEICAVLSLNIVSLVTGILSLVFYNDPQVQDYFARLNAGQA